MHKSAMDCIHGIPTYSCAYCNGNEDFDSDDDGEGLPTWFVDHDNMPASREERDIHG